MVMRNFFNKTRKSKRKCLAFVVIAIFVLLLIVLLNYADDNLMIFTSVHTTQQPVIHLQHQPKIILIWTPFWGFKDWSIYDPNLFGNRSACSCLITYDRSYLPHASTVLFHWRDVRAHDLPLKYKNQKWVFFLIESPPYTRRYSFLSKMAQYFDCSATYRQDSDFPVLYGCKYNLIPSNYTPHHVSIGNKQPVAWVVSNCNAYSYREKYVEQLEKYIPVDKYGLCFKSCNDMAIPCQKFINENYLFYLAFENSICKDYFTEKVVEKLGNDIVPVVMGGTNYSRYLPPNSYIDVTDFDSPKSLAQFLTHLSHDEKRYNSYFTWKSDPKFQSSNDCGGDPWCRMCDKLSDPSYKCQHETKSLGDWWFTEGDCKTWMEIVPKHSKNRFMI